MVGPTNRPPGENFNQWMREMERSITQLQRRPVIRDPHSLVGPGFGPNSIQIVDWNGEEALFSGHYWSDTDALNGPVTGKAFVGTTITNVEGSGTQRLTRLDGTGFSWYRGFTTTAGIVTYTTWTPEYRSQHIIDRSFTTNVNGDSTWTFPTPFPNALVGAHITPSGATSTPVFVAQTFLVGAFTTTSVVSYRCLDMAGAPLVSTALRANITVWGY